MQSSKNTDDYSWVTTEMFHAELEKICGEIGGTAVLHIPGVYEAVGEFLNNEVLARLERARE